MARSPSIERLGAVVALVERAAPMIEITDRLTVREALSTMRSRHVGYARVVRTDGDAVRSALVSSADLRRLDPHGARALADGFEALPTEVMVDWLDLMGDTARDALAAHPDARLVSVEDSGQTLGVLPAELVAAAGAGREVGEATRPKRPGEWAKPPVAEGGRLVYGRVSEAPPGS